MIIAVVNQKGGVGKTTTAVNLAHGLAMRGQRVLLIDLDSQGHVAYSLGIDEAGSLYDWILSKRKISDVAIEARKNLDIIRGDKTTQQLKTILSGSDFRELVLVNALRKYGSSYTYVLFDCPPSSDILHTAALMVADRVIVPTKLEQLSSKGVLELIRTMRSLKEHPICRCELAGILPTFYDKVTSESDTQFRSLVEHFKKLVWPPVYQDTLVRESSREGRTLFEYAPKSRAALAYEQAVDRVEEVYKVWERTTGI